MTVSNVHTVRHNNV